MKKNKELSKEIAHLIKARPRRCYANSVAAVWVWPEIQPIEYVEGIYAHDERYFAIEHGWLEWENQIIDPTLPDRDGKYFPALRFVGEEEVEEAEEIPNLTAPGERPDYLPFFYRLGWGGWLSPSIVSAHADAFGHQGEREFESRYRQRVQELEAMGMPNDWRDLIGFEIKKEADIDTMLKRLSNRKKRLDELEEAVRAGMVVPDHVRDLILARTSGTDRMLIPYVEQMMH